MRVKFRNNHIVFSTLRAYLIYAIKGAGAKIDACTDQGRSALLYACSKNRQAIVKKLLNEGANINLEDKLGATPLHRASGCGHYE